MNEFVANTISNLAGELGASVVSFWTGRLLLTSAPSSSLSLPSDVSDSLFAIEDAHGETAGLLSVEQVYEIKKFINTPEVGSLIQTVFLARFAPDGAGGEIVRQVTQTFYTLTKGYCQDRGLVWQGFAEEIWRETLNYYQSILPSRGSTNKLPSRDRERLAEYVKGSEELRGADEPLPVFVRKLIDLANDHARLTRARESVRDIKAASASDFAKMRLIHAQDEYRFRFEDLYIDRNLKDRQTGVLADSGRMLGSTKDRPRAVVIGDPGVGKSTLVDHLIHAISSKDQEVSFFAPILLKCREYGPVVNSTSLLEAVRLQIGRDLHIHVEAADFEDMLTLGRAFVIFDGVDEIVNLSMRRRVVERIQAFSVRFPLVSILATTRKVGYTTASFEPSLFDTYELQEYSESQVEDYVTRWFRLSARSDAERDGFLRESNSVRDIRNNPLMLSLLCILYRARGYIPHNRREVYRDCADLLFYRWDSLRGVEQPFEHRRFGHHIMQDLAHFFWLHPPTQAGLEERQLRGLIAAFFDTAGVPRPEAEDRATQFLDYCSTRAWLLSLKGSTDRGERLFGFTHRTFMEYYTAEVIVRRCNTIEAIAVEVVTAYRKDASSVLPDLMVQCADEKFDRGAEQLIKQLLLDVSGPGLLALCLRLVNSAPVSGPMIDKIFSRVFAGSSSTREPDYDLTMALFELYRDPRTRLLALTEEPAGKGRRAHLQNPVSVKADLCARWIRLTAIGEHTSFEPEWGETMSNFYGDLVSEPDAIRDPVTRAWLIVEGFLPVAPALGKPEAYALLAFNALGKDRLGYGVDALLKVLDGSSNNSERQAVSDLSESLLPSLVVHGDVIEVVSRLLQDMSADLNRIAAGLREGRVEADHLTASAIHFCLWLSFALYEHGDKRIHPFHQVLETILPPNVSRRLFVTRNANTGFFPSAALEKQIGPRYTPESLRFAVPAMPSWVLHWCNGRASLLA